MEEHAHIFHSTTRHSNTLFKRVTFAVIRRATVAPTADTDVVDDTDIVVETQRS